MKPLAVPAGGFRNIAVLRLSSLGDVVLTLPVVHALARAWPESALHYWVKEEYADVVRFDPAVRHVRALERDARRIEDLVSMSAELEDCDLIVDLHASLRTRVLTFRQAAPVLRVRGRRLARERWVRARWSRPAPLPHATARYAEAEGARWFAEPLERVTALLGECALAVTHDSGLMHLAAACGRRVVALFGSTSPVLGFGPSGEGHAVLCRDLPCQPCTVHGRERCPLGHFRCMTSIAVNEVVDRVRERVAGT